MTRLVFSLSLLMMLFVPACAEPPQPCIGDSCPRPCKVVANAEVRANEFTIGTTAQPFQDCYARGTSHTVSFDFTPRPTANLGADQTIIVVDVVRNDGVNQSVLANMFDRSSFSVNPNIFSNPIPMSQLRAGIKATINFTLLTNAPQGDLVFVVSAFRGTSALNGKDLIGRIFHYFRVE